jgi:hypothetical protein
MRLVCLLTLTRISVFLSHRRHAAARKHQPLHEQSATAFTSSLQRIFIVLILTGQFRSPNLVLLFSPDPSASRVSLRTLTCHHTCANMGPCVCRGAHQALLSPSGLIGAYVTQSLMPRIQPLTRTQSPASASSHRHHHRFSAWASSRRAQTATTAQWGCGDVLLS